MVEREQSSVLVNDKSDRSKVEEELFNYKLRMIGQALVALDLTRQQLGHKCICNTLRYVHFMKDMDEDYKDALKFVMDIIKQEHRSKGDESVWREEDDT